MSCSDDDVATPGEVVTRPSEGQNTAGSAVPSEAAVNDVRLQGRVSGPPLSRTLPSGDSVVQLRLVVPRAPVAGVSHAGRTRVDTIEIACWSPHARAAAEAVSQGETVRVAGALRRRFWRSVGGLASRYEVEAFSVDPLADAHEQDRPTGTA